MSSELHEEFGVNLSESSIRAAWAKGAPRDPAGFARWWHDHAKNDTAVVRHLTPKLEARQ